MWIISFVESLNALSIILLYGGSLFFCIGSGLFIISYEFINCRRFQFAKEDNFNLQQAGVLIGLISGIIFLFGAALACVLSVCSPFEIEKIWVIQKMHKILSKPIYILNQFLLLIKMVTLAIGLTYLTAGFFQENCAFAMGNENPNQDQKIGLSWILAAWIAVICSMTLEITEFWIADAETPHTAAQSVEHL